MFQIICLDNGKQFYFKASTPYEALNKMKYYLKDDEAIINITETGQYLYFEHNGMTYVIKN